MKGYSLLISDNVYNDLEDIFQYSFETFGINVTEQYLERIHTKMEEIARIFNEFAFIRCISNPK